MTLLPLPRKYLPSLLHAFLQTSQLFAVYCSNSCIIILVFVLKCSKLQDDKVNFNQTMLDWVWDKRSSRDSVSCNCDVQQSVSHGRRWSSPYKPVRLKQRSPQAYIMYSMLLIQKLKCDAVWPSGSYYSYGSCWANKQHLA